MIKLIIVVTLLCSCEVKDINPVITECNLPSVLCSNGEMWNGRKCPNNTYVMNINNCDSIIYKHR